MRYFLLSLALFATGSLALGQGVMITPQWATTDAAGRIDAVIVAPGVPADTLAGGQTQIALVSQEGTIYRAEPSAQSHLEYSFVGVPSGVYTLTARGPNIVACYAVHVVDQGDVATGDEQQRLEIGIAEMRINKLRNAVIRYMPTSVPYVAKFDDAVGRKFYQTQSHTASMRVGQTSGGLKGRILRAGLEGDSPVGAGQTNILLYQNRELIAQVVTEADGSFSIDSLEPGIYSLIAIGPDGIAVTGFQLISEPLARRSTGPDRSAFPGRLVALQQPSAEPQLQLQLAPSGLESPAINELLQDQQPESNPVPPAEPGLPLDVSAAPGPLGGGGAGGGGGYAGGGGIGGGGGLGMVLGITAAGAGIAAFSSDDDDAIATPPVISPLSP